jgi:hypothetical protein
MSKYIKVTMIFEPDNGSTMDIDTLKEAVKESVMLFAPEPRVGLTTIEVKDTEDDDNANL